MDSMTWKPASNISDDFLLRMTILNCANPNALSNYVKCKIEARSCLKEALEYIGSIFGIFKCFLHSKENLAIDAD